ncbi:MAG: GPI anchored serine-threonine rich family protein [Bryobacteraceae bacterium]|nr:GPI anchored serine-threonine rich family protein [Bryobacteraceae bacterium]
MRGRGALRRAVCYSQEWFEKPVFNGFNRVMIRQFLLVALCVTPGVTALRAEEPGFTPVAARQQALEAHLEMAIGTSDFEILLEWLERASSDEETYVHGYRVMPRVSGEPLDLYLDEAGSVLSDANLGQLGIQPKQWDLPPAQVPAELLQRDVKRIASAPAAKGPKFALSISGAAVLPEVDVDAALAEDMARVAEQGKGAMRIGVVQEIDEPVIVHGESVSHGFWQSVSGGGHLWSIALFSPEALGMRVHFADIDLPSGAELIVYDASEPAEAYGPYPESGESTTNFWSATCFTDTVVVECFVPAGVDRESVRISIDRVVHNYIPFSEYAGLKAAGSCNKDVSCYPEWAGTATGVGGVGTVSISGSFFCSGALIADTDATSEVPYLLTANHCVSSQSLASTLELYWLYQTSTCNGVPPSLSTVPRTTGGAQLLATSTVSAGTDFTLLRLNNTPPAGLTYLGWNSSPMALGTVTTCIHHPSVDFKRITFGVVTDVAESLRGIRPAERFYQSSWTLGTTEPGSSGSPLMIESTQQIIGQLWGGPGSCTTSTNLDYYGRFDVSYPLMAAYLNPMIVPEITVTRPDGAKNWPLGGRRGVRWTSSGVAGKIRIELWRNGSFVQVIKKGTRNDGKARWNIDPELEPGVGYSIRILSKGDPSVFDDSDGSFALYLPEPPPASDPEKEDTTTARWPLLRILLSLLGRV